MEKKGNYMKSIKKRVLETARRSGKKGISYRELLIKSRLSAKEQELFSGAVRELKDNGLLTERKRRLYAAKNAGLHSAVISRINKTFGFAVLTDNDQELFIPGKYLKGALPGDKVEVRYIPSRREGSLEGEVVAISEPGPGEFSGMLVLDEGRLAVLPDSFARFAIPVVKGKPAGCELGDKVAARVVLRGLRHADHRCRILESFGSSAKAASCAKALLKLNGIPEEFSAPALEQAERLAEQGIRPADRKGRLDLREEVIFTIDSADSKDLDDAVSLSREGDHYRLGVHIADVSHYVTGGSPLDQEAFVRGTSLYYADRVVPMLPEALSNGICSLNPGEDRLAFSALLTVSRDGELLDFDFKKSVIRSRVKGVYSEINQILAGEAPQEILDKYRGLTDSLALMEELADILTAKKRSRGAPEIETNESRILIGDDGAVADIQLRSRGKSERIIEEFMLLANQAAATLGRERRLPFVYRVHEQPLPEKIDSLKEILHLLGINVPDWRGEVQPGQLAAVLDQARGSKSYGLVNLYVLRSMAKARYSEEPLGHFGLVLRDYAHFTSPIRRYPDLAIHRILSCLAEGTAPAEIQKKYRRFAPAAALQSTNTELRAMQTERQCEDCYKAEYMAAHLGEEFAGVISSAAAQGVYVELPNTVEGLVRAEVLGDGFEFDGLMEFRGPGGKRYRVGDPMRVKCIRADVNSGQIDFEPIL